MSTVATEVDEVGTALRMIADLPPEARKWIVTCEPDCDSPLEDHLDSAFVSSVTQMSNARMPDGDHALSLVALAEGVCLMARTMLKDAVSDFEKECARMAEVRRQNRARDAETEAAKPDDDQEDDATSDLENRLWRAVRKLGVAQAALNTRVLSTEPDIENERMADAANDVTFLLDELVEEFTKLHGEFQGAMASRGKAVQA